MDPHVGFEVLDVLAGVGDAVTEEDHPAYAGQGRRICRGRGYALPEQEWNVRRDHRERPHGVTLKSTSNALDNEGPRGPTFAERSRFVSGAMPRNR